MPDRCHADYKGEEFTVEQNVCSEISENLTVLQIEKFHLEKELE